MAPHRNPNGSRPAKSWQTSPATHPPWRPGRGQKHCRLAPLAHRCSTTPPLFNEPQAATAAEINLQLPRSRSLSHTKSKQANPGPRGPSHCMQERPSSTDLRSLTQRKRFATGSRRITNYASAQALTTVGDNDGDNIRLGALQLIPSTRPNALRAPAHTGTAVDNWARLNLHHHQ